MALALRARSIAASLSVSEALAVRALRPCGALDSSARRVISTAPASSLAAELSSLWLAPPEPATARLGNDQRPLSSTRLQVQAVASRCSQQRRGRLPVTLEGALMASDEARVITEAVPPFRITHVNAAWEELCGYRRAEVLGSCGFGFLQGPATDVRELRALTSGIAQTGAACARLVNYARGGTAFTNDLRVAPLVGDGGRVTHLLGVLTGMPKERSGRLDGSECSDGTAEPDLAH